MRQSRLTPLVCSLTVLMTCGSAWAADPDEAAEVLVIPVGAELEPNSAAVAAAAVAESAMRATRVHIVNGRVDAPFRKIQTKVWRAHESCTKAQEAYLELEAEIAKELGDACIRDFQGRLDYVNAPNVVARAFLLRGTVATLLGISGRREQSYDRALALDPAVSVKNLWLPKADVKTIEERQEVLMETAPTMVSFSSSPPAAVYLDGIFVGVTPTRAVVARGQHEWSLRRSGYRRMIGTIKLEDGGGPQEVKRDLSQIADRATFDLVANAALEVGRAPTFWGGKLVPPALEAIAEEETATFVLFIYAASASPSTIELVWMNLEERTILGVELVVVEEDLVSARPLVSQAALKLSAIAATAPSLAKLIPPPLEETVPVLSENTGDANDDESEGLGSVLLWGGAAAATTVVVAGVLAGGAAAAFFLAPDLTPAAEVAKDPNPFGGSDGQARRRAVLGL